MIHLGLIGYPLGHSLSPKIHSAALRACGLEGDYSLFAIPPADMPGLKELIARVRSGEIAGLNVTVPHKQNVLEFMDELTLTAKAIGAVSTIYLRNDKVIGDNMDAPGFLRDMQKFLGESPSPQMGEGSGVREKSALVLGAGGSARAVVYALLNDGWNVALSARRPEQAQQLISQLPNADPRIANIEYQPAALSSLFPFLSLVVNTTPLGMAPNIDGSPWPENLGFPAHAAVYDLVYNPRETKLVKDARSVGLRATTGLGMLVEQAALAFTLWTRQAAPREIMVSAVEEE